jgi:hypothetical protein
MKIDLLKLILLEKDYFFLSSTIKQLNKYLQDEDKKLKNKKKIVMN